MSLYCYIGSVSYEGQGVRALPTSPLPHGFWGHREEPANLYLLFQGFAAPLVTARFLSASVTLHTTWESVTFILCSLPCEGRDMAYVHISKGWPALKWHVWVHLPLFQVDEVPKKLLLIEICPGRAKEDISFPYKQSYPHRPVNRLSLADKYCACRLVLVHTWLGPLPISVTWEGKTVGEKTLIQALSHYELVDATLLNM